MDTIKTHIPNPGFVQIFRSGAVITLSWVRRPDEQDVVFTLKVGDGKVMLRHSAARVNQDEMILAAAEALFYGYLRVMAEFRLSLKELRFEIQNHSHPSNITLID